MATIEFEVDDAKWNDFKKYFLIIHPNQTLDTDNPLSNDDWIRYRILLFARGSYEKGLTQEFEKLNGPVFDTGIITLT